MTATGSKDEHSNAAAKRQDKDEKWAPQYMLGEFHEDISDGEMGEVHSKHEYTRTMPLSSYRQGQVAEEEKSDMVVKKTSMQVTEFKFGSEMIPDLKKSPE